MTNPFWEAQKHDVKELGISEDGSPRDGCVSL